MSNKYLIQYEALAYNMPECGNFEFLGHTFVANNVTPEIEQILIPDNDIIKANITLQSCCLRYHDGHVSYVTAKNKTPLEVLYEGSTEELQEKIEDIVRSKIDAMEQHLIFTTNIHIFFPTVKINVYMENSEEIYLYGFHNVRPMPYRKWTHVQENIDLERRLHSHIDKNAFDKFRLHKNRTRYNRAFNYYIRAFYEYDHASAFCILCSALDAITGSSAATDTKERLAKYSSVLFCTPLEMKTLHEKMRHFYKIRSLFTHGKGNQITISDEIEMREYVRKFLLAYFLFWQEMGIKNEPQMLQKLDEIYATPNLYTEYVPGAYGFLRMSEEQERRPDGIMGLSMQEKAQLLFSKMAEALVAESPFNENKVES